MTYEQRVAKFKQSLDFYKSVVGDWNVMPTDRKKILSLPFYMNKRNQDPEPKKGQNEYLLFEEVFGSKWHDDEFVQFDSEPKITEFNYEQYIHPDVLEAVGDPQSNEFKRLIKSMNFATKTKYEQHQENKEAFK